MVEKRLVISEEVSVREQERDFPGGKWLRLCASTAGGTGSIPRWGTKIPHAAQCGPNKQTNKQKQREQVRGSSLNQGIRRAGDRGQVH